MKVSFYPVICLLIMSASYAEENFHISEQTTHLRLKEEPLQWTPESVTVIRQSEIEATFRRTLEDIENYVPGMIIDPIGGTPRGAAIAIRGIHSNRAGKGFEPAVAVSVDGVYVGTHGSQNQVLFDFEQIEIARGTQGTFSGVPAEAGTINIRRTKPTGEFDFVTRLGFGDFNRRDLDFVLNYPIIPGLAGKLSGTALKTDEGDLTNSFNGKRENAEQRYAYSLSLLWNQLSNLSIQYTLDADDEKSDTPALFNLSDNRDFVCSSAGHCSDEERIPDTETRRRSNQNFFNDRRLEGKHHTLHVQTELMGYQVTSTTGIRATEEYSFHDFDAAPIDFYSSTIEQDYDQFSTEFNVLRSLSEDLTIAGGFFWLESEYDLLRNDLFVFDNLNNNIPLRPPAPFLPQQSRTVDSTQESTIRSIFAHADYRINDQWNTNVGLRHTRYDKDFDHRVSAIATTTSPGNLLLLHDTGSWTEISGHLGFSYKVDEEAMIYFRYGIDHTPGGYNDNTNSVDASQYRGTETTQSVELGMKSEWLNDRLRLNMVFYQSYQDDKIEDFFDRVSNGNIEASIGNQSDLETTGYDLEFEVVAMRNLYFRGIYGHMNSSYASYSIPDLVTGETLRLKPTSHRAPADEFYLTSQYFFPYAEGMVHLFAGYRYVTEYQTNPLLTFAKIPSHTTWDFSIQYDWKEFTFRVFSQNANDKNYLLDYDRTYDAQVISLGSALEDIKGISTYAEINRPRYTGFEIIWVPEIAL